MKLTFSVAAAAVAVIALGGTALAEMPKAVGAGEGEVDIVAWPGYIERGESDKAYDWVTDFEKETGCKVNVKTAATSDEMVTLMNEGGFDLVTASGDASLRLVAGKRVQQINVDLIPSWKTVDERLQDAPWHTVDGKHYGVPYQWGPNVLMYNTDVFKEAPKSWSVVFEEQKLPDGKTNKGRVQAYDGAIYIADAALYLMTKKPELGIKDPYELNAGPVAGGARPAAPAARAGPALLARRHGAGRRLQERRRRRLLVLAVSGQSLAERQEADRLDHSRRRRDRLGRHDHDARRRQAPELRLYVDGAFAEPEGPGRRRRLVRLGAGGAGRLQGQRAPDRRRLRDQRLRQFREDQVLEDADGQVRDGGRLRPLFAVGEGLHRHRRQVMRLIKSGPHSNERGRSRFGAAHAACR